MPGIFSIDQYMGAVRQVLPWFRSASRTAAAGTYTSVFDRDGIAAGGVLAGSSTAAGVVPTDAVIGYPPIAAFGAGAIGYLTRLDAGGSVPGRTALFDRLFLAGAYPFNANVALAAQPSFAGRVPLDQLGAPDYSGLEIWLEQVTAGTLSQSVAVTYTNQAGVAGRTTGTVITATNIVGRCHRLPLQAGDTGVQKIESVVGSVASAGTFNIMVLRRLADVRVISLAAGESLDLLRTGMPQVFDTTAFYALIQPDSTATGTPEMRIEVASA